MKYFFSVMSLVIVATVLAFTLSCVNGYFYPVKYKEEIISASDEFSLSPALIASVVNVESSYRENARSQKGAVGLMQLLPSTAKWLSDRLEETFDEAKLETPQYNIRLGSFYLSYLLNMFEDEKAAICAYNAGPSNVSAWLKNKEFSTDEKSLEKVPFPETEKYLNKVMKNFHQYLKRYK